MTQGRRSRLANNCAIEECPRPIRAGGLCSAHYQRQRKGRDMSMPFRILGDDRARFWQRVDKTGDCWIWTGRTRDDGYGIFTIGNRSLRAHRVSFAWDKGEIPLGMEVDHICHTRACVRPSHLRLATSGENSQNLRGAYSNSTSGVRGVSWYKTRSCWRADAKKDGVRYFIGYFPELGEAEAAVTAWRRENMPYSQMDKRKENA